MGCPYTWFRQKFAGNPKPSGTHRGLAEHLHVRVVKAGEEKVLVALPARSARWLIELIPEEVVKKIYEEEIPLDAMLDDLKGMEELHPQKIFALKDEHREVEIWLE